MRKVTAKRAWQSKAGCVAVLRAVAWSSIASIVLGACATPTSPTPPVERAALLAGTDPLAPTPVDMVTPEVILAIDDEIRAFVHTLVGDARDPRVKLERLLAGMRDRGLLSLDYLDTATQTVRETFYEKRGNCLSFTMLFVALAREAGLEASYRMVDIPPTWSSTTDIVTRNNHINSIVTTEAGAGFVVDFNSVGAKGNYETQVVSDDYAVALYYNNVGAAAFVRQEYGASLVYFRKALEVDPTSVASWNNLGVLYSRTGSPRYAESAYLEALAVGADDPSVLTNLAILYAGTGRDKLADEYRERAKFYRLHNPYYHYSLALEAFDADQLGEALSRLRRAIRLKDDEHQFYYLRGRAHFRLGQLQPAEEDFEQALRYAPFAEVRAQYEAEIRTLAGG